MFNTSPCPPIPNLQPKSPYNMAPKHSSPSLGWIDKLESKMRKGVRKQMKVSELNEEASIFFKTQKQLLRNKAIVITTISMALFYMLSIEPSIIFSLMMLLASQLICTTILPFSDSNLISNLRKVQPIIYSSVYYSLFKWALDITNKEINYSIVVISLLATTLRYALIHYYSFLHIQMCDHLARSFQDHSIVNSLRIFVQYERQKIGLLFRMARHLIMFMGLLVTALVTLLAYLNQFKIQIFQLNYIFMTIILFSFLELYLDVVEHLILKMSKSSKLKKMIKDQMPIFMTLLRLEPTPINRMIQFDCLQYIILKTSEVGNFLSTQTCQSLLYNTYLDIFCQFALSELSKTHALINDLAISIKINDKAISQQANLLMDLFVYFKKIIACISSEWSALKLASSLSSINFISLIIKDLHLRSSPQTQQSKKLDGLYRAIISRIRQCSSSESLSSFTCIQLSRVSQKLSDFV